MSRELTCLWLGRRRYAPTYALQQDLFERRKRGEIGDVALLLEHEPVITLGRGARAEHLLASREELAARGIDVESSDRGGEITLHAPGQLVCYPIVNLAPDRCDVRRYVRDLSATMRELVAPYGLDSGELPGLVGVWVDAAAPGAWPDAVRAPVKIGAIGVRLSRWVSMHGFALNLSTDLSLFRLIVPCGITEHGVASVASFGVEPEPVKSAAGRAARALAERLERVPSALLDAAEVPYEAVPRLVASRADGVAAAQ